jgi:signal transduction histidine kinase
LARPASLDLNLIDINETIQEVLNLVQQQAQEQKITIHVDLATSLQKIYGEVDQLKQVLLNIILNAFAAMGTGGELGIKSRFENRKILVDIKDTGKGMPIEIQEKVFDLYFTTKRDGGGVGLAVCKNIMEAHEGKIYFKSIPDKGTIFTIQLPVKDPTTISKTQTRIRKISYSDIK